MSKKNQSGGFIFFVLAILIIVGYTFYKEKELSDNKEYTKGKIIDYYNVGGKKYITYIFLVNNRKYTSKKRVNPFKCDDGTEGCVGKTFTVYYSSKDPNNNDIYLEKYDKHRPNRIRLF